MTTGKQIANYTELQLRFKQSPTFRILRVENALLVLAVLFTAFKREHHQQLKACLV
jgi:hypothetical protein